MQVTKQLQRMYGMSAWVNDIKIVVVQKMTFCDWNWISWFLITIYVKIICQDISIIDSDF